MNKFNNILIGEQIRRKGRKKGGIKNICVNWQIFHALIFLI